MSGVTDDRGWVDVDEAIALYKSRGLRGDDQRVYLELKRVDNDFCKKYNAAMREAWDRVDRLDPGADGGSGITPALGGRIVDMIQEGLDDALALVMLDRVYLQNGLYAEYLDVCGDILKFKGHARDVMVGSTLVEYAVHQLVSHLSAAQASAQERDGLAAKCAELLKGRARMLGMDMFEHGDESDPLYRADLIAMDICARRSFEPPGEIAGLLQGYPRLCAFLGLAPDGISPLVEKRADIAYYASVAINVRRATPFHERPRAGPLDELEWLLGAMKNRGLDARDGRYDSWRSGMCGEELLQRLLEMRLYLHFLPVDRNLELEPAIDNGKKADLRVRHLYIEAFAPHEAARTAFGHIVPKDYPDGQARKVLRKKQIDSFGDRLSMIVMEDPRSCVDDGAFHRRLACMIRPHTQLGGVLIARDTGGRYACRLVRNPGAAHEITPGVEQTVTRALETPCFP